MEGEILQIMQGIWSSVFGLDIEPGGPLAEPSPGEPLFLGWVSLTGARQGVVAVQCSEGMARLAAGLMFSIDPRTASIQQVQDALGEVTNMVAGNLKALLPPPCKASLPLVTESTGWDLTVPGSRVVSEVALACLGEPVLVRLLEGAPAEGVAATPPGAATEKEGGRPGDSADVGATAGKSHPFQREFTRVGTRRAAVVTAQDHGPVEGESRDVCMKGLYVLTPEKIALGTLCSVQLPLTDDPGGEKIQVRGRVVRVEQGGFAVEFLEMDVNSYEHLRRLVLHNSTDPAQVEREFGAHLGLKRRD